MEMGGNTFKIGFSFFCGLYIHHITGYRVCQENNPAIGCFCNGLAFGPGIDDGHLFEYLPTVLSSHLAKVVIQRLFYRDLKKECTKKV